jgi:hypothetical protein
MLAPPLAYMIGTVIWAIVLVIGYALTTGESLWGWPAIFIAAALSVFGLAIAGLRLLSWWRFDRRGQHGSQA